VEPLSSRLGVPVEPTPRRGRSSRAPHLRTRAASIACAAFRRVTNSFAMANGETRALLSRTGETRVALPRASDFGVHGVVEKKTRSRWHFTVAGLLAPCAATLLLLVAAFAIADSGLSARANDSGSVRARLGSDADGFFHARFHDASNAGLGMKTRREASAEPVDADPADASRSAKREDVPELDVEETEKKKLTAQPSSSKPGRKTPAEAE